MELNIFLKTKTFQFSSRHVLNGKFEAKMEFSNEMTIHITGLNLQGNQYKKIMEKDFGKFCDALYVDAAKEVFEDMHSHFDTSVPWKACPYPKGPNEIHNYLLKDVSDLLPAYVPGGEKWQVQVRFHKDDEVLGGYNFYLMLRSEESLLLHGG